jgi:putative YhdH/YhfP family quinone oxidoreductase
MEERNFKALVVDETEQGTFERRITKRTIDDLPEGEVLVKVAYSSLNYKDALSATGNKGVTRGYPHTPGIDAAGQVAESHNPAFKAGDAVIVTSYDLGMNTSGGFGQYVRVPADWVVPLPDDLTLHDSMVYGTAGFTAGLSIFKMAANGVEPEQGTILVTGASGGVGSLAVAILVQAGYQVAAVSGKAQGQHFLQGLGVQEIITREEAVDTSGRPFLKGRWAGVIDTVGGDVLATAIKSTNQHGTVTCCGNVAGPALNTTVFPFILRGVSLLGIDSQNCPMTLRRQIWQKLAGEWKLDVLDRLTTEISLDALDPYIERILKGEQKGRVVVNLSA